MARLTDPATDALLLDLWNLPRLYDDPVLLTDDHVLVCQPEEIWDALDVVANPVSTDKSRPMLVIDAAASQAAGTLVEFSFKFTGHLGDHVLRHLGNYNGGGTARDAQKAVQFIVVNSGGNHTAYKATKDALTVLRRTLHRKVDSSFDDTKQDISFSEISLQRRVFRKGRGADDHGSEIVDPHGTTAALWPAWVPDGPIWLKSMRINGRTRGTNAGSFVCGDAVHVSAAFDVVKRKNRVTFQLRLLGVTKLQDGTRLQNVTPVDHFLTAPPAIIVANDTAPDDLEGADDDVDDDDTIEEDDGSVPVANGEAAAEEPATAEPGIATGSTEQVEYVSTGASELMEEDVQGVNSVD